MSRRLLLPVLLALTAFGAAACGDDGGSSTSSNTTAASPPAAATNEAATNGAAVNPATTGPSTAPTFAPIPSGTKLRVADQSQTLEMPLTLSGQKTGLPYEISWSNFAGGPPMLQAFNAGAIDIGWVADLPPINAQAAGLDIRIIATATDTGNNMKIVARKSAGIASLGDLKGKKVAYAKGTSIQTFLGAALQKANLSFDDIKPVTLPVSAGDFIAAFQSGDVDAAAWPSAWFYQYQTTHDDAVIVSDSKGLTTGQSYLITTSGVLKDPAKEAAIADFITRVIKSQQWVATNADTYIQKYSVEVQKNTPENARKAYEETGFRTWGPDDGAAIAKQQGLADLFYAVGGITKKLDVSAIFETRYNALITATAAAK